jgi:glyoxylase-like metal-dependent hydrolase (beta-lactamase superfamily II)
VLLDEITPNVGRWPDTARDPLGRYLATLRRIAQLAPARVYPGHGPVITEAAARACEIAGHHEQRLDAAAAALDQGAETAYDAAQLIWQDEPLGFHEQRFALVEAISHLERLVESGRAEEPSPGRWRPGRG